MFYQAFVCSVRTSICGQGRYHYIVEFICIWIRI